MLHLPVNWFLQWRAIFFPGMATSIIIPRLCLQAGQITIFSTYSCERLNFPALAKIRSYSVTFVRERLQLLRWFFTWTTLSLLGEEPQVIFAIPAKEHFAGACAILVVCQQRKLRFRWSVGYGPLSRMTESSSVIENGINLLLKNFWRQSGAEGESVLVENRIYRSHF